MDIQKLLNIVGVLAIVGCIVFVVESVSDNESEWEKQGKYVSTKVVKIKGHDYIIATVLGDSVSVIHANHCFCNH